MNLLSTVVTLYLRARPPFGIMLEVAHIFYLVRMCSDSPKQIIVGAGPVTTDEIKGDEVLIVCEQQQQGYIRTCILLMLSTHSIYAWVHHCGSHPSLLYFFGGGRRAAYLCYRSPTYGVESTNKRERRGRYTSFHTRPSVLAHCARGNDRPR